MRQYDAAHERRLAGSIAKVSPVSDDDRTAEATQQELEGDEFLLKQAERIVKNYFDLIRSIVALGADKKRESKDPLTIRAVGIKNDLRRLVKTRNLSEKQLYILLGKAFKNAMDPSAHEQGAFFTTWTSLKATDDNEIIGNSLEHQIDLLDIDVERGFIGHVFELVEPGDSIPNK